MLLIPSLLIFSGCAKPSNTALYPSVIREFAGTYSKVLDVPNVRQSWTTCGPAALTESLQCLGVTISLSGTTVSHDHVADMMKGWDGATDEDMERTALRFGCRTVFWGLSGEMEADLRLLKELVHQGHPVIVGVRHNTCTWFYYRNHYMLVTGFTRDHVIVHNGDEPYQPLSNEEFYRMWKPHGSFFYIERKP